MAQRIAVSSRVLPHHEQPADLYAVMPTRTSQSAKLRICLDFLRQHLASGPYALDLAV